MQFVRLWPEMFHLLGEDCRICMDEETSQRSLAGLDMLGLAKCCAVDGQGSPLSGASAMTGHHLVLASSFQASSMPPYTSSSI